MKDNEITDYVSTNNVPIDNKHIMDNINKNIINENCMNENCMNENCINENCINENNISDNIWKPDILVLGPGGAKAYLEIGALMKLNNVKILDKLIAIVGCSVGAIIGALYLADYTCEDILAMSLKTNFFNDIHSINVEEARKDKGLISTNTIRNMLSHAMKNKYGFIPTLSQFYHATGKTFTTVTVNLTKWRVEYLCHETHPDLSVIDAIIFSLNIPLIFYRIMYQGCVYIDGAFGNPYPANIYDNGEFKILGLHITSTYESNKTDPDAGLTTYLLKVLLYPISQLKKDIIDRCSNCVKHLELFANTVDVTGLSYSLDDKTNMLYDGYMKAGIFYDQLLKESIVVNNDKLESLSRSIDWGVNPLDFNPDKIDLNGKSKNISNNEINKDNSDTEL